MEEQHIRDNRGRLKKVTREQAPGASLGDETRDAGSGEHAMTHDHTEGVPLNIWPLAATRQGCSILRRELAARAVETYAPPGGIVVDLNAGEGEGLAAAVLSGRNAVVLPDASEAEGRRRSAALRSLAGTVDLVMALPAASHLDPPRPWSTSAVAARAVADQASTLLRPGGFLVLGIVGRDDHDDVAATAAAVSEAGLAYFQHLVAILPDHAPERCGPGGRRRSTEHADVLVFARRTS